MRQLCYEIVPGFQSTAILYEPEKLQGKMPAILNVNGQVGPIGKVSLNSIVMAVRAYFDGSGTAKNGLLAALVLVKFGKCFNRNGVLF
jgi:hypothetical protein